MSQSVDLGPRAFTATGTIAPFRFVAQTATEFQVAQSAAAASILDVFGVIDAAGASLTEPEANVQLIGIVRVEAGAAIASGNYLMPNATGQAIPGVATNFVRAVALEDAAGAGAIIEALLIGALVM